MEGIEITSGRQIDKNKQLLWRSGEREKKMINGWGLQVLYSFFSHTALCLWFSFLLLFLVYAHLIRYLR